MTMDWRAALAALELEANAILVRKWLGECRAQARHLIEQPGLDGTPAQLATAELLGAAAVADKCVAAWQSDPSVRRLLEEASEAERAARA